MQAVILAAGQGVRLRPLTNDIPKPLVSLGSVTILEYTLSILPPSIDEVILVISYRGEKIQNACGSEYQGKRLTYALQEEPKGTGDALRVARPYLRNERFLLAYADDLYYRDDLAECVAGDGQAMLVSVHDHPERFGVCLLDESGQYITDIIEKPEVPPSNLVNIGVYTLHPDIFSIPKIFLPNGEENLAAEIGLLARQRPLRAIRSRFWHPIGYPHDVENAKTLLETGFFADCQGIRNDVY